MLFVSPFANFINIKYCTIIFVYCQSILCIFQQQFSQGKPHPGKMGKNGDSALFLEEK